MKPAPTDRQCCTRGTTRTRAKVFNYVCQSKFSTKTRVAVSGSAMIRIILGRRVRISIWVTSRLRNCISVKSRIRIRFRIKVRKGSGSALKWCGSVTLTWTYQTTSTILNPIFDSISALYLYYILPRVCKEKILYHFAVPWRTINCNFKSLFPTLFRSCAKYISFFTK